MLLSREVRRRSTDELISRPIIFTIFIAGMLVGYIAGVSL